MRSFSVSISNQFRDKNILGDFRVVVVVVVKLSHLDGQKSYSLGLMGIRNLIRISTCLYRK